MNTIAYWINLGVGTYNHAVTLRQIASNDTITTIKEILKISDFTTTLEIINKFLTNKNLSVDVNDNWVNNIYKIIHNYIMSDIFGILNSIVFTNSTQTKYYIYQTFRIDCIIMKRITTYTTNNISTSAPILLDPWTVTNKNYMDSYITN